MQIQPERAEIDAVREPVCSKSGVVTENGAQTSSSTSNLVQPTCLVQPITDPPHSSSIAGVGTRITTSDASSGPSSPWETTAYRNAEKNCSGSSRNSSETRSWSERHPSSTSIFYALLSSTVLSRSANPVGLEAGPLKLGRSGLLAAYVILVLIAGPFIINFSAVYRIHQTNSSFNWLCLPTSSTRSIASSQRMPANETVTVEAPALNESLGVHDQHALANDSRILLLRSMGPPSSSPTDVVMRPIKPLKLEHDQFGSFDDDLEGLDIGMAGQKTCSAQRRAIYNLIPIGMTSLFFFSVAGGAVADFVSAKVAAISGLLLSIAGWVLLALSSHERPYFQLATMFFGAGSDPLFIALLNIRCLFPEHRATVICVLYSARYVAYAFPLLAVSQLSIELPVVAWTYCGLLSGCLLVALVIVPNAPFKYNVEPVAPFSLDDAVDCSTRHCAECGGAKRSAPEAADVDTVHPAPKSCAHRLLDLLLCRANTGTMEVSQLPDQGPTGTPPGLTLERWKSGGEKRQPASAWAAPSDGLTVVSRASTFSTASRNSGVSHTSPYSFSSTMSCSSSCSPGYSVNHKFRASRALPLAGSSCRNARSFMSASSERCGPTSDSQHGGLMNALRSIEQTASVTPVPHTPPVLVPDNSSKAGDEQQMPTRKKPLDLNKFNATFFVPMLPVAASCLLCCMFFSLTSARQFQQHSHRVALLYHRILTPLSFIPAVLLGYLCDTTTPMLVLTLIVIALFAQFTALFLIPSLAYLTIITNLLTAAFVFAQVFCYVTLCFPQRYFATLSGLSLSLCGLVSLIVTPMYDFASFENRFEPMNALCLGSLALDFVLIYYLNIRYKSAIRWVATSPSRVKDAATLSWEPISSRP